MSRQPIVTFADDGRHLAAGFGRADEVAPPIQDVTQGIGAPPAPPPAANNAGPSANSSAEPILEMPSGSGFEMAAELRRAPTVEKLNLSRQNSRMPRRQGTMKADPPGRATTVKPWSWSSSA